MNEHQLQSMKVLLVDDSRTIRLVLRGLLNELRISGIFEAGDGRQAVDILESEDIDVMFIDIHMPKMSGLDCLDYIKSQPQYDDLPAVIISSDTDYRQIDRAKELGALGYIKKPFHIDGLRSAIQAALEARREALEQQSSQTAFAQSSDDYSSLGDPQAPEEQIVQPVQPRRGLMGWLRRLIGR